MLQCRLEADATELRRQLGSAAAEMCSRVAQADKEKDKLVHLAEREADLKVTTLCRACSRLLPYHCMLSSPTMTSNNQIFCLQIAEIRLQANAALKAAHRDKLGEQRRVSDLKRQACIGRLVLQAGLWLVLIGCSVARFKWLRASNWQQHTKHRHMRSSFKPQQLRLSNSKSSAAKSRQS